MARKPSSEESLSLSLPVEGNTRILLIEDDASYAGYVQALFYMNDQLEGEVVIASSLAAGVAKLMAAGDFAAVLLDLNLPDSRGLETLRRLLGQAPAANVIVLTGNEDRGQGVKAVAAGAQDFLVKNNQLEEQLPRAIRFSIQRKYFLQRLEEAQNLARIGNWEVRPAEKYFYASPSVYNFFRLERDAQVGISYDQLLQHQDSPLHHLLHHQDRQPAEEFYHENIEWELTNGDIVYGLLNSRRSQAANGVLIYTGTLQDVTLQRRAEELQRARDLAEETARVREQVLANVSHELRTPMNAILGMSNILAATELDAEQRECTDHIQEASQVLLGIINNILLSSSLQHQVLETELQPFDLAQTIGRIVEVIKPKADAKKLTLRYKVPDTWLGRVVGDKQQISQVLYNLLGNAVKFTEAGSVELRLTVVAQEDGRELITISISDTGPGIPEAQLEDIFQPFVRIKQANRRIEGTGLGLNIARQLVNQMGGTIKVQSVLGQGTTFTLALPLRSADPVVPSELAPASQKRTTLRLSRLLVVEDHPMNQLVIRRTLERELPDLELHLASSGEEALELIKSHHFDVILMDLQLPGIDGYETTVAIRRLANGAYRHIPILAMTAQAQVAQDESYRDAGMVDYILKPFDPEELFTKLAQYTQ